MNLRHPMGGKGTSGMSCVSSLEKKKPEVHFIEKNTFDRK